jgi:Fanconi anemia group M protein
VQRRGRTGRQEKGKVVVLIARDTIDEGYRWSAHHKEKRMIKAIKELQEDFNPEYDTPELTEYVDQPKIIADYREKGSGVIRELSKQDIDVELKSLDVADYVLSEDAAVEYKTVQDFVDSVVDGRLLDQVKSLRQYKKPLVIVEGTDDMYAKRKIHPNAIRGMLLTIMLNYNIGVLQTRSAHETAAFMKHLAKREQEDSGSTYQYHSSKPLTLEERQEYVVAAMPGVGNKIAKPLLDQFGTIKRLVNASVEELKEVELIGEKKAEQLRELFDATYDS